MRVNLNGPCDGLTSALLLLFITATLSSSIGLASADAQVSPKLDVNDVSILLPPPSDQSQTGNYLGFSFQAINGPLFLKSDFDSLVQFSGALAFNPNFAPTDFTKWMLLGVRFDPCMKENPLNNTCHVELRLIFQPYVMPALAAGPNPTPQIEDDSIHLIYELPATQATNLVQAFVNLKMQNTGVATNGIPLGIHPSFTTQTLTGPFATQLSAIIKQFAGRNYLRDATSTFALDGNNWRFTKSTMVNGQLTQVQIPFSPQMTMTLNSNVAKAQAQVVPQSLAPDNVNQIVDSINNAAANPNNLGHFYSLSSADQDAAIQQALRIDNPKINGPLSTDCVSCHQAGRALIRVNGVQFLSLQDGNQNRFTAPANMTMVLQTGFFANPDSTYNLRAFGYTDGSLQPAVSQGAINSSADVADRVNRMQSGH